ncbi:MAG: enoyl-CoA hydratase/isomerase family protein [Planctomycetia bacterium]|nr:enoyl-CoA hydratase/isomerase family protein [Planctomycetia bacterium]
MALVDVRTEHRIRILTLNDPPANAYSHEMMKALDAAVIDARFDAGVDVIVLTGAGDRFFCAGANIEMLTKADPTWKYHFCLHANETLLRLEHTPKVVIAALNGHTVGGGLEVALAADLRFAKQGGGKIGAPEVALGVLPGTGGTQRLTRLLGPSKAIELMVSGRNFEADEALALGLVNQVFPAASFWDDVIAYARTLCLPNRAALAAGAIKRACQTGAGLPLEAGLALERELQAQLFRTADAKEGMGAFVERRKPTFKGC